MYVRKSLIEKHDLTIIHADPPLMEHNLWSHILPIFLPDPSPRLRLYAMLAYAGSNYVVAAAQTLVHQEVTPSTTSLTLSMVHSRTSSTVIRAFGSSRSLSLTKTASLRYLHREGVPLDTFRGIGVLFTSV